MCGEVPEGVGAIPRRLMNSPSVFLLGSGAIAVPPFERLLNSGGMDIVGIATQPDRPAGRKRIPTPTPVGRWGADKGLDILKPESVNSEDFLAALRRSSPDIVLVASFGQILKRELLDLPSVACVNIHASLLPKYRGASPIAAAILAGDERSGVSFMRMDAGLDTGPVYAEFDMPIRRLKADGLEMALAELAAEHAEKILKDVTAGALSPIPQNDDEATITRKTRKSDGAVDWRDSAVHIDRMVRAYHPWPGAFFRVATPKRTIRITITDASPLEDSGPGTPGESLDVDGAWTVACGEGALAIARLIPEGGREMSSTEFLRGRPEIQRGSVVLNGAQ